MTDAEKVKALRKAAEALRQLEQNELAARCDDQANRVQEASSSSS